jgi:peptide chain release factor
MKKKIIQITAGRGPIECCRVVAKIQERIMKEAEKQAITIEILDSVPAGKAGTYLSITLVMKGDELEPLITEWEGAVQWIAQSPYRNFHKRKNWFVGVTVFDMPEQMPWNPREVVIDTCRSSGPGGQNVNKVETAVRGTHTPSGIQVLASDSRSQLQNKKLCLERLQAKVLAWQNEKQMAGQQNRWQEHNELERGNPVKVIMGEL